MIRIPHDGDGKRQGADDFILAHGADAWGRLIDSAQAAGENAEPRTFVCVDFAAPEPEPIAPLVGAGDQTFIPAGEKILVAADSGAGKTHTLAALAVGIAAGVPVLGFACSRRPVLLVSSDDDPDLPSKFRRHGAGLGVADLSALPLRVMSDAAFVLDDPGCLGWARGQLADLGAATTPAVFILESLSTNIDPDLTDLADAVSVRAFIRRTLAALQHDFMGLTCIVSHHLRKMQQGAGNDLGTRISGSHQIKAGFDCAVGLAPNGDERFTVRTAKRSRSGGRFAPFRVRIVGQGTEPRRLVNEGAAELSEAEVSGAKGAVLAFLKANPGRQPVSAIVAGVAGFGKRAVQKAAAALASEDEPPILRVTVKPAAYTLAPPKQTDLDLGML